MQFYTQIKMVAQQWSDFTRMGVPSLSDTDIRSQGVSSLLHPSSERGSPNQRESSSMSVSSDRDSPTPEMLPPIPMAMERDLPDPGVSSLSPTANVDLPNQGESLLLSSADMELSNQGTSLARPPATERDLSSQRVSVSAPLQSSQRIYMPQTSHWSESPALHLKLQMLFLHPLRGYMCLQLRETATQHQHLVMGHMSLHLIKMAIWDRYHAGITV